MREKKQSCCWQDGIAYGDASKKTGDRQWRDANEGLSDLSLAWDLVMVHCAAMS